MSNPMSDRDVWLWSEGTHRAAYLQLGAHPSDEGTRFAVWAPNADSVSVIGDFNDWNPRAHSLTKDNRTGIWQGFIGEARIGHRYKYRIARGAFQADKTDPYARHMEPPITGAARGLSSVIWSTWYEWGDRAWMQSRKGPSGLGQPLAIYEVHLGSWRKRPDGYSLSYRDIAQPLADHVQRLGFTHIELMPVMEHPFYGSWGYQVVGYYAPTHRYGTPQDLMYLIDYLHQRGIGVILDWVPAHFATNPQGLVFFDGSPLYEYGDPRLGHHPDWGTYVFDYVKPGVKNFLVSNALFWHELYHVDGLRIDAVASMLYRDYSRAEGEWLANMFGGRESLEAIDLLKEVNEAVYSAFPESMMIAEESTAWPGVSKPTYEGGLGFLYKWNMGWMHDTLEYMAHDPVHRRYHQNDFTFPLIYAFSEHYMLPLSHDEVVHGKGSLWQRMPGDDWQKAANLRLLYGHMLGHPGKKLLFMGQEFGQVGEWSHDHGLEWSLADSPLHTGLMRWLADALWFYRKHPALWNDAPSGFAWVDFSDSGQSVASYLRRSEEHILLFVFNMTPIPRTDYRVGVPVSGRWLERLNSDAEVYGGSGMGNLGSVEVDEIPHHSRPYSISLTLPPLAVLVLEPQGPITTKPARNEIETTFDAEALRALIMKRSGRLSRAAAVVVAGQAPKSPGALREAVRAQGGRISKKGAEAVFVRLGRSKLGEP